MGNVIISNQENFEEIKDKILFGGAKNFHVLADFDKTLTKAFVDGKVHSTISILRDEDYLSEEYSQKAHQLFDEYHPIEISTTIPLDEKKKKMQEWWSKHFELLINSGLNKKHLERIILEDKIQFREGTLEFFDFLNDRKIPLVIISASGVGDVIPMLLEKYNRLYDNVKIITNLYDWNEEGDAIGIHGPVIHSLNKDETVLREFPKVYSEVENRKNVLLLGDGIGDLSMVKGFLYDALIKIGFLNDNIEENLDLYKQSFDVVITNDSDMNFVNDFVKQIN